MSLDDDIARVAALRGKPVANYVEAERDRRRIHSSQVRDLFKMASKGDMRAYDALPRRSRLILSELPINASAVKYRALLAHMQSETGLVEAVRDCLPGIVRDWVLDHYGRDHPGARRLT